ncbi:hydrolase of the HAD superfamily protein [Lactobacillus selangorensis]|uniref:Hydrolase of the HAD superfamily protein n=1 Tax=Lactobacillus selangorensis TaxID=81857 RepID=A0A0R2FZW0_9LACO|nr:HD domain-containing protein [Lactobacillus selangorensis]KRN29719.1 hydrolase of the HAD superfamily protein [Lactobacillus selangorensis]KRN33752.1 hydrolase of the HAD superfamily protein [Lactobacillus selangorensis]
MSGLLAWQDDPEYVAQIDDLLHTDAVQKLNNYTQHHSMTRLEHSLNVSYRSYLIGKKLHLNTRALARAGLLHDLFYYDWRKTKFNRGTHAYIHPRVALRNAEKITELTPMEKDIIVKHMWGATIGLPRYKETWVVSLVDDYCAMDEYMGHLANDVEDKLKVNH